MRTRKLWYKNTTLQSLQSKTFLLVNSQKIETQTQESWAELRAIIKELRAIKFTCAQGLDR